MIKNTNTKILSNIELKRSFFEVVFSDNGIFEVIEGGVSKVIGDGFYIIIEPLTKGNYLVHFKSSLICLEPDCAESNFAQDIKYNIIAK